MLAPAISRFTAVDMCSAAICCAGSIVGPAGGRPAVRTWSSTDIT